MKYKFEQKELVFKSGRNYFDLSIDILGENGEKDKELSDNVSKLIGSEYTDYKYLEKGIKQLDDYVRNEDGSVLHDGGAGVYWQVYSDQTVIWNWINEEDRLLFEKTWIDNATLLTIGKHYYEIKNTYVTDKGYLGVTDEIFEI
ncbi:hypothetical protein HB796_10670 [Listeria welshimeri]|nr:hypothetical protein [Listeria welshimeri]MBC1517356.1 hypothetical protein [Listeria welshimeri]MBC1587148.1 hypothetical protein [Listeria welshimeri]MBC1629637.1 hypothetical protein [Listeria welshimeri]MBC1645847.1 hypothetical protein [Listeria welshimeri]